MAMAFHVDEWFCGSPSGCESTAGVTLALGRSDPEQFPQHQKAQQQLAGFYQIIILIVIYY